jgi:hypothetical protein
VIIFRIEYSGSTIYKVAFFGGNVMKRVMSFLIVLCSLFCGSTRADMSTIHTYGLANGVLYDINWYSIQWDDAWYAEEGTLSAGDPPVYGDLLFYSEPAGEEFYVASEVGVTVEGAYYAMAHAEASSPWEGPYLGTPFTFSWSGGKGAIWFTIENDPLLLHWIEEGFEEYEDYDWQIEVNSLIFSAEGTWVSPVWQTDSEQELLSEGIQLIDLPPADAYELIWSIGINSLTPGDHGWAQLSIDLTEAVPIPGAVILGILGLGTVSWKIRKKRLS